ncbi:MULTISPECIES: hypothetical protein, partial [unclassified Corynebacterium]|uniref:hypothetical protein n=1 Tax=Corynebacterium sp. MSK310 TaxID=3050223 RepID=UPI00254C9666
MVVDYLSSQLDWAGYQVSTKWGSGPFRYMSNWALRFDYQVRGFTSILRCVFLALLTHNEHPVLRTQNPH